MNKGEFFNSGGAGKMRRDLIYVISRSQEILCVEIDPDQVLYIFDLYPDHQISWIQGCMYDLKTVQQCKKRFATLYKDGDIAILNEGRLFYKGADEKRFYSLFVKYREEILKSHSIVLDSYFEKVVVETQPYEHRTKYAFKKGPVEVSSKEITHVKDLLTTAKLFYDNRGRTKKKDEITEQLTGFLRKRCVELRKNKNKRTIISILTKDLEKEVTCVFPGVVTKRMLLIEGLEASKVFRELIQKRYIDEDGGINEKSFSGIKEYFDMDLPELPDNQKKKVYDIMQRIVDVHKTKANDYRWSSLTIRRKVEDLLGKGSGIYPTAKLYDIFGDLVS
jgi:hypothetical protein